MGDKIQKAFDLSGRTALITGGGSGIGKGCAKLLAEAGANVVVVGRRIEKLQAVKEEIIKSGGRCEYYSADLTVEENCKSAVEATIEKYGRLDILINSAGGLGAHGTLDQELDSDNIRRTMETDFNSTVYCIKHAYPYCQKNHVGSVINIASLAALRASGPIIYSAAKGAVKSMSKNLGQRFGQLGVRVNTIYPGFIITEMTEKVYDNPEMVEKLKADSSLGLLGNVDDIAYCALYLASDASRFVTGQDFVIDGGAMCC